MTDGQMDTTFSLFFNLSLALKVSILFEILLMLHSRSGHSIVSESSENVFAPQDLVNQNSKEYIFNFISY